MSVLLGAGTSCAAGLPDVNGLLKQVLSDLTGEELALATDLYQERNLEEGLTRLRRIRGLLGDSEESFAGFTAKSAESLEGGISARIIQALSTSDFSQEPSVNFATWAAGDYYTRPLEVFTVNYDLLIEQGLESVGASYFDGFVGNLNARFRPDLIEPRDLGESLPKSFVRLWKLHGSLNWKVLSDGTVRRTGAAVDQSEVAAIYPSDDKYNQSRRVPFLVLQDRLRRALAEPESLTLVCGYSFGDDHLNEILFDAAKRYPRSEIAVFCYAEIPAKLGIKLPPNLTVYGAEEAIIGGERTKWCTPNSTNGTNDAVWKNNRFTLGDFVELAQFLANSRRQGAHWAEFGGAPELIPAR